YEIFTWLEFRRVLFRSVTYTLTVTNNGPSDAQNVNVTDSLPAGETFVSASEGTGSGGTFTDTVGTLAAGATRIITLVASVGANEIGRASGRKGGGVRWV